MLPAPQLDFNFYMPPSFCPLSLSKLQLISGTMASTPMDIDVESSPADVPQLNITRTLGTSVNATAPVSEVIANFRPTKVRNVA